MDMEMQANADLDRDGASDSAEASFEGSSTGSVYCALEQDYAKIANEMKGNEALAPFKAEYVRLFEALYQAHRLEKELTDKCQNLEVELELSEKKIKDFGEKLESNETTIAEMREEVHRAKVLADAANKREQVSREMIENLKISIDKLNREKDLKGKLIASEDVPATSKDKGDVAKDRERLLTEVDNLEAQVKTATFQKAEMEKKFEDADYQLRELKEKFNKMKNDLTKEKWDRENLELELENLKEQLKDRLTELKEAEMLIKTGELNVNRIDGLLKEKSMEYSKAQKEIQKLMRKQMTLNVEVQKFSARNEELQKRLDDTSKDQMDTIRELHRVKEELSKTRKDKDLILRKLLKESNGRLKAEENYSRTNVALRTAELELSGHVKQIELEKKALARVNREKETIAKSLVELEETNRQLTLEIKIMEQSSHKANLTIEEMKEAYHELERHIGTVEKDRDRFNLEAQELELQVEDYMDEVKMMRHEITDCKKHMLETDAKLRQQSTVFDELRSEKNNLKKNLGQAQEEIVVLKDKLKDANLMFDRQKEELATKEATIQKHEFLFNKKDKEIESLKLEVENCKKTITDLRAEIADVRQDEKKLKTLLRESDSNVAKLKKEVESVMNERDIIGAQIVRRNDELSLQYQRIQTLSDTLSRGEKEYAQRLEEIRLLQLEVKKLRIDKAALSKNTANIGDLRGEVLHLERNLTKERLKVVALEEEVQNPLNIHRWRNLEGTDPDSYELLKKIQILQKRIIKMSSEMIVKEKKIKDTERVYMNLREILMRQPGPEIYNCLINTKAALRNRGKKMKCLIAELNVTLSSENKYEMEKLKNELNFFKAKYFALKKRLEPKQKAIEDVDGNSDPKAISGTQKKILGGGFHLSHSAPAMRTNVASAKTDN